MAFIPDSRQTKSRFVSEKSKSRFTPDSSIGLVDGKPTPVRSNVSQWELNQEERMKNRPDLLNQAIFEDKGLGFGGVGRGIKAVGGLVQRGTAAIVNPLIEAQRGRGGIVPGALSIPAFVRGLTGKQLGEVGDIYTGAGAGEGASATLGLGTELGIMAPEAIVNAPKAIMGAPKYIGEVAGRVFRKNPQAMFEKLAGEGSQLVEKSQALREAAGNAVRTVGARQSGYIDANATRKLANEQKFNQIIENLPPQIKEEVLSNPSIQREIMGQVEQGQFTMGGASKQVTPQITKLSGSEIKNTIAEPLYDPNQGKYISEIVTPKKFVESPEDIVALQKPGYPRTITSISPKTSYAIRPETSGVSRLSEGEQVISPNLKNAETIRAILKSKIPTSKFQYKGLDMPVKTAVDSAYSDVGGLMKERDDVLAQLMNNYRKAKGSQSQIAQRLVTKSGQENPSRLLTMFGKDPKQIPNVNAVKTLAENNPEILKIADDIRRFGKAYARKKWLGGVAKKGAGYAALGLGGKELWDLFN